MKKYLFPILFLVFSFIVSAQEKNSFNDYLSHYEEVELPYEIHLDSMWQIFPHNSISKDYVREYLCDAGKPCDDSGDYDYIYGTRINLGQYFVLITCKFCFDCPTEFGLGTAEYLMTVYTSEGQRITQSVIAKISYTYFSYIIFTKGETPCELLSVSSRLATVTDFIDDKNGILKGVLDYNIYIVDHKGKIEKKRMKSNNIKVHWGRKIKILEEWE